MERPGVEEVLDFWFADGMASQWFRSSPELDHEICRRFLATWEAARDGRLADWEQTAEGACALVIVRDQFPLNMFRGEPRSFATEAAARDVTCRAIEKGFDRDLEDARKAFLYMPLMHSEDIADQDRSVALYEAAGLEHNLKFARHHRELIRRFGRFPHRNAILGRENTAEEEEYLRSEGAFLG